MGGWDGKMASRLVVGYAYRQVGGWVGSQIGICMGG